MSRSGPTRHRPHLFRHDATTTRRPRKADARRAHRITEMADRDAATYPAAMKCLLADREGLTAYLRFPAGHHHRIRHSNFIERTFGETRRRTKVIGRLPGETTCLTLVWAVLDRASRGWRGLTIVQSRLDYHGSKVKTAGSPGMSRAMIYRKIHQYGIITPPANRPCDPVPAQPQSGIMAPSPARNLPPEPAAAPGPGVSVVLGKFPADTPDLPSESV
jgi:hypothetical protein